MSLLFLPDGVEWFIIIPFLVLFLIVCYVLISIGRYFNRR